MKWSSGHCRNIYLAPFEPHSFEKLMLIVVFIISLLHQYIREHDEGFPCIPAVVALLYFNFHITNFPFLSSNIPSSPAYGVFISQLIRYARASSSYECFILMAVRLSNKLLGQGYVKERLRSSLRKFYGRYGDLIKQYEVPLSRMLHDILDDDHLQWHPPLIRHYTNFWHYYWSWPYNPNLTFYLIARGFHGTFATGAACQQRTLTPPDTWSCPTLGLVSVLMLRPISPDLVLFLDFWVSNIPRYICLCFLPKTHNLTKTCMHIMWMYPRF